MINYKLYFLLFVLIIEFYFLIMILYEDTPELYIDSYWRGGRRGPDPEIPGLKTRNPEVPNLNKVKSRIPKFEKKNSRIPKG